MGGWGGLRQSNKWTGWTGGAMKDRVTGGQVDGWGDVRQSNRWTGGTGGVM